MIVVDGPTANSYVTVDELEAFAAERGIDLPESDVIKGTLLIKAMDYLETLEGRLRGHRAEDGQGLPFPRIYNYENTGIPDEVKKAQMVAAIVAKDLDLMPVASGPARKEVKVGPIGVTYADAGSQTRINRIPQVENLRSGFFKWVGQPRVYPA